ncbi:hypothetical protein EAO70_12920 [Streptomyces sp. adm13(2018)]|uniref:hypothetical protein n=1 Tax=Streptomyces sp. adm13(2018) TaxID=2479007 RepID=UPI0011CDA3F3|nr:hypothetical protein [Streptomyces sp. adm13(2018)]TXS16335.1 hypothetical protein EAO70_12920 [Streptomyces sp. adm13(2018)]
MSKDWTVVVPAAGQVKETAVALLALADSPADVRTDGNGTEFLVPPALADRYHESLRPKPRRRAKKDEEDE